MVPGKVLLARTAHALHLQDLLPAGSEEAGRASLRLNSGLLIWSLLGVVRYGELRLLFPLLSTHLPHNIFN